MGWRDIFEDSNERFLREFLEGLTPKQRERLTGVLDRDVEEAKVSEARIEANKVNLSGLDAQCRYLQRQGYGRIADSLYHTLEQAGPVKEQEKEQEILAEIADLWGWNDTFEVTILLRYIAEQGEPKRFRAFLEEHEADLEPDQDDGEGHRQ